VRTIIFVVITYLVAGCSYCTNHISPLEFRGIVKKKFLDKEYKDVPRIIVATSDQEIMFSPVGHDTLSLYQYLKIGDSLVKQKGSYNFRVVRGGASNTYTINCY
jgi:hypothetical protein